MKRILNVGKFFIKLPDGMTAASRYTSYYQYNSYIQTHFVGALHAIKSSDGVVVTNSTVTVAYASIHDDGRVVVWPFGRKITNWNVGSDNGLTMMQPETRETVDRNAIRGTTRTVNDIMQTYCSRMFVQYDPAAPIMSTYISYETGGNHQFVTAFEREVVIDVNNRTITGDIVTDTGEEGLSARTLDMKIVRQARKDFNDALACFDTLYKMRALDAHGWPTVEQWNKQVNEYNYDDIVAMKPFWWMKLISDCEKYYYVREVDIAGKPQAVLSSGWWGPANDTMYKFTDPRPQRYLDALWRANKEMVYERVGANKITVVSVDEYFNPKSKDSDD